MKYTKKELTAAYFFAYACYGRTKYAKTPPKRNRIGTLAGYKSAMNALQMLSAEKRRAETVRELMDAIRAAADIFKDHDLRAAYLRAVDEVRAFLESSQHKNQLRL